MALGRKTGGRAAGTPNRQTREVNDILQSLGCNPIEGMARIAMNSRYSAQLRGRMFAELAQYVYPKRKNLELAGAVDLNVQRAEMLQARRGAREAREQADAHGTQDFSYIGAHK
jgi:hypothetical protein